MKKRFVLLAVLLTVILIIPVLFLDYGKQASAGYLDNTVVNGLLNELSADWDNVNAKNKSTVPQIEGISYEVMDNDGRILVRTNTGMPEDLGRATSERYTIRDIKVDGEVVGKLLISNDFTSMRSETQKNYERRFIIVALAEALLIALFLLWVYRNIIKPFEDLKEFASDIASGDLDKPLKMDRGNIFGSFTESFDIMRSELSEAKQKEYEAQRSKMELVSQLSHDIKTPVASIKALGELLEAQSADPKTKERLGSIVTKADNIDAMVSDLFTETLTELNELNVETSEQESRILDRIIRDADHMELVTGRNVEECIIMCDPLRVTQVINNIIFNSYKYAGTKIYLESHIEDDYLVVSFTDEGGGVSNDEIPMITKRFRRGENAKGKPGSGLGLAIAYELMEKMGGDLEVANADKGLRVSLFFKIV
ncbi:MAG: HAMP domain-containing sensor histidine kinase [Eubacteriales bacterium]|nr:HAMP domain-containing sensor histidine kinase [Eubacteriales bacterium]